MYNRWTVRVASYGGGGCRPALTDGVGGRFSPHRCMLYNSSVIVMKLYIHPQKMCVRARARVRACVHECAFAYVPTCSTYRVAGVVEKRRRDGHGVLAEEGPSGRSPRGTLGRRKKMIS